MSVSSPKIVHCLIERVGDQWQAFSLELGLAAQADSAREAAEKLERMVRSYVYDATQGEDKEFAGELLSRRATLNVYMRYYYAMLALILKPLFRTGGSSETRTFEFCAC